MIPNEFHHAVRHAVRREVRRVPRVPDATGEAPPGDTQLLAVRSTPPRTCVAVKDAAEPSDTLEAGDAVFGFAPTSVASTAVASSGLVAHLYTTIPLGDLGDLGDFSAAADALPEDLTLDEIAAILMGTQDQQRPNTPSERVAAQQVAGLVYRVKECARCAPRPERPLNGTTSTSCPRHLIEDQVQLLRQRVAMPPASTHAAALRHDEARLGRLLHAVAVSDDWSTDDWALAARTLDDLTAPVAVLHDAPVIQHAIALCHAAAASGRGIAHDRR